MTFWYVKKRRLESDYDDIFVNGLLEHPFNIPGVSCDVCGESWANTRINKHNCPESFRQNKDIAEFRTIPRKEHEALQAGIAGELDIAAVPFVDLRPGDCLQPGFLDIPTYPRADFLWSYWASVIVSERIKEVLLECCSDDVELSRVTFRRVGVKEAELPARVPDSGEPEDLINQMPVLPGNSEISPYYEVIVNKESEYPRGVAVRRVCNACKRVNLDSSQREIKMYPEMWKGDQMFLLSTTLLVVITDNLKRRLEDYHPTNVEFELA